MSEADDRDINEGIPYEIFGHSVGKSLEDESVTLSVGLLEWKKYDTSDRRSLGLDLYFENKSEALSFLSRSFFDMLLLK